MFVGATGRVHVHYLFTAALNGFEANNNNGMSADQFHQWAGVRYRDDHRLIIFLHGFTETSPTPFKINDIIRALLLLQGGA